MTPPQPVVDRYHRRLATLRALVSVGLLNIWDDLDSYTDADLDIFMERAAPLLAGAKAATVATSAAFFALAVGTRPAPVASAEVLTEPRISHPFLATWHAIIKEGRSIDDAIAAGRSQVEAVGFDYVQSTARQTGDHVAKASGRTVKWRRRPGSDACSWCRTVAGQLYRTAASADFGHDRCDCIAVPA